MSITGKEREIKEFGVLKTGLFNAKVICVNPSRQEFKDKLGIDLKEESKQDQYTGESKDGNQFVRINIWLKSIKDEHFKAPIQFYLEDKVRTNKDGSKTQYINNTGMTTWVDDPVNQIGR